MKTDILTKQDIQKLIFEFYTKVRKDELLAPIFAHVDWDHHTPIIVNFWTSLLMGDESYRGNPFQKHIKLSISKIHFERWLHLFHTTIDEHFDGAKAAEAKGRALNIAALFQHKLGLT